MSNNPTTVFPSILPGRDDDFVDDTYNATELKRMDGNDLQTLAAQHPTEEVNGHSTKQEIREGLEGKERIEVDE